MDNVISLDSRRRKQSESESEPISDSESEPVAKSGPAAEANAALLSCELRPGLTIGAALRWLCGEYETYDEKTMNEFFFSLKSIGLAPHLESSELAGLAHIRWPEKLIAAYPALKQFSELLNDDFIVT